ncbi:hypothetical protein Cantr_09686 [Candida viswanathii]|uniref:Uncharacterized protein n=1 Tax=Candida viswanathii TaxID=5486 RepID=A0A367YB57_9ASCO|nr:hypothetical protein Cantr_09686 [Candida viswanathii]
MVVGYLVSKVPFSDHIPVINRFSPKKQQQEDEGTGTATTVSRLTSSGSEEDDFEEYSENDEIKPIELSSPKDKIHTKLMDKRQSSPEKSPVVDDGNIFDTPKKGKPHLSFVDSSSTMTVSQRLARRESKRRVTEQGSPVSAKFSNSSRTLVSTSTREDGDSEEDRQDRIDKYLENQNNKFDELISKNIDVVLHPESSKTDNQKIIQMVYDNRKPIMRSLYQLGKAEVSSRLPYIPYFNPKNNNPQPDVEVEVVTYTRESTPTLLGSPFTDYCHQVIEYDGKEPYIEEPDSAERKHEQERFDDLMKHLDDEIKVDIFLDSLDDKTKVMLYELLKHDLKDYHHDGEFKDLYHSKNVSPLDKLQVFVIISVKLVFTGLKLFIPITKYLIHKFRENQLFIFNKKNVERLVDLVLTFMNYLDSKLTNNEDIIDKMYKQDYVKAEEVYQDFTTYTANLFKPSNIKGMLISENDHVAGNVYDFVVGRITSKNKNSYVEDPQYAKFYSRRRHTTTSDSEDAEGEYGENIGYRAAEVAVSASENSVSSTSSSSGGEPSIFKAAEKFFDEM